MQHTQVNIDVYPSTQNMILLKKRQHHQNSTGPMTTPTHTYINLIPVLSCCLKILLYIKFKTHLPSTAPQAE